MVSIGGKYDGACRDIYLLDLEDVSARDDNCGFDHVGGERSIRREDIIGGNSGGESNSYRSEA